VLFEAPIVRFCRNVPAPAWAMTLQVCTEWAAGYLVALLPNVPWSHSHGRNQGTVTVCGGDLSLGFPEALTATT
jgi:hypothetical protein